MLRLLLLLTQIQVCGLRKSCCSVPDWSYGTDKTILLVETEKNLLESPDITQMWTTCHSFYRDIKNLLLILARGKVLARFVRQEYQGGLNPREKRVSRSRDIRNAKRLILLTRGWRPSFEISFSDSHGGAISALAVSQGHLGCPDAPIRAWKGRGFVEISAHQGTWAGCSNSKSASQIRAAELFWPLPRFKDVNASRNHKFARKKVRAQPRYPQIKTEPCKQSVKKHWACHILQYLSRRTICQCQPCPEERSSLRAIFLQFKTCSRNKLLCFSRLNNAICNQSTLYAPNLVRDARWEAEWSAVWGDSKVFAE